MIESKLICLNNILTPFWDVLSKKTLSLVIYLFMCMNDLLLTSIYDSIYIIFNLITAYINIKLLVSKINTEQ